ncbi:MAG: nucleotide exchange factor GrpE [Methanobacterium sp.]|uniref:nucleotide exchange factor GrpE n=1 Tax=Methanobacterium sp. TaxID=2164 RepID=UPI003D658402|nr:nucleotide exchange factor GrpE [Methanobacterium sp.]
MTKKDELKTLKADLKEKESEIEDLNAQIGKKDQKIEDYFSQIQRLQADFENYKKRNEKDRKEYIKFANEGLILKIIEIYEDLERALKSSENGENLKEGVELIYKNLNDVFEKEGLEIIPAEGEKFDPFKHEALMTENNEKYENGIVTEELAKGYTLNSKVIKCAMVKVCKK